MDMDLKDYQTSRPWGQDADGEIEFNRSQAFFQLEGENVLVQEGFTPFDEVLFSDDLQDVVLFEASPEPPNDPDSESTDVQSGSLLYDSIQGTQILSQTLPTSTSPKPRTKQSPRTRSRQHYPSPDSSEQPNDDDTETDEYKPPTRRSKSSSHKLPTSHTKAPTIGKRRNGHTLGINRQTGELTLIGHFPPINLGPSLYACPHCWAPEGEKSRNKWTTRNGYKYHLEKVCPAHWGSTRSKKMRAAAEAGMVVVPVARKKEFLQQCEHCEVWFKSEAGYRAHRETNVTTRQGLCRTKGNRGEREVAEQSPVVEMGGQPATPDQHVEGVPQMLLEPGRLIPPEDFDYTNWIALRAWESLQQGMAEQSTVEEPGAQPEAQD